MRFVLSALMGLLLVGGSTAPALAAPDIVPSERVVRWVNVRAAPDSSTPTIAQLKPGEKAELLEVIPAWYRVRLADGREGYVSRAWTDEASLPVPFNPKYFVHMIDVGTGLAVYVEGPGFNLLYDAGSNDDTARGAGNRVVAYLRKIRPTLTRIDHVVISHPHKDHVELLPDILATYAVANVWDSGRTNPICAYRAVLEQVQARGIAYHDAEQGTSEHVVNFEPQICYGRQLPGGVVRIMHSSPIVRGQAIPLGAGATLRFLHASAEREASFNENSLVASIDLGRSRVLLMGDGEAGGRQLPTILPAASSVEGQLVACCANDLKADVLVVGHHGSKTSSRTATLDKIQAYVFLVSAGPTRYQTVTLPDREVIDELATRGTVLRTDEHDAQCRTDPAKIGADNDNQAGGCENVLVEIDPDGPVRAHAYRLAD
jgi:competence protein ComEC